jgi:hypothetical protein
MMMMVMIVNNRLLIITCWCTVCMTALLFHISIVKFSVWVEWYVSCEIQMVLFTLQTCKADYVGDCVLPLEYTDFLYKTISFHTDFCTGFRSRVVRATDSPVCDVYFKGVFSSSCYRFLKKN